MYPRAETAMKNRAMSPAFAPPAPLTHLRAGRSRRVPLATLEAPGWAPSHVAKSIRPVLPPPSIALPPPLPRSIRISPRYTAESAQFSDIASTLTPSVLWRFVLLSDGHIIQHLVSLTKGHVRLSLLGMSFSPELGKVQRRIALLGADGYALLYATSTWDYDMYYRLMAGREHTPLWEVFKRNRVALAREISAVHFGTCADLERYFDVARGSGMWARDYMFTRKAEPFLSVHEVFSPQLASCLGPVIPPAGISCVAEKDGWDR